MNFLIFFLHHSILPMKVVLYYQQLNHHKIKEQQYYLNSIEFSLYHPHFFPYYSIERGTFYPLGTILLFFRECSF